MTHTVLSAAAVFGAAFGGMFAVINVTAPTRVVCEQYAPKCEMACGANGGVERMHSNTYCWCENGASFMEDELDAFEP